jgi:hypothetical protein
MTTLATRGVPPARNRSASAVLSTMRQFGAVLCAAGAATVLQSPLRIGDDPAAPMRTAMLVPIAMFVLAALATSGLRRIGGR